MANNDEALCPICGAEPLVTHTAESKVTYKGHMHILPLVMSLCSACEPEQAGGQQARDNKRAVLAFRKKVDDLPTGVIHGR